MEDRDDLRETLRSLTFMMGLDEEQSLWEPGELVEIFAHQLAAPLQADLAKLDPNLAQRLEALEGPPIETFAQLFAHPSPPVEVLDLTRRFAKACRNHPDGPLPDEIATVLYFLAIAVAITKCDRRITRMDDQSLRYSLDWALQLDWLDDASRALLQRGRSALGSAAAE